MKLGGKIVATLVDVNSDSHHSQMRRFVLRAHLHEHARYFVLIKLNVVGQLDRGLKAELAGEIDIGGPDLAQSLTALGLIDEYRLYLHPVVLGRGKPFFASSRPPLRFVASDRIGEATIRLTYVPA